MFKKIIKYFFLFIVLYLVTTLFVFLFSIPDLTSEHLVQSTKVNHFFQLPKMYLDSLKAYPITSFISISFLTILFFFNSSRLKRTLTYKKAILITVLWSILLTSLFFILLPQKLWDKTEKNVMRPTQLMIENLYKSSHVLNINGKVLIYAHYNPKKKIFRNVVIISSHSYDQKILFSDKAELSEDKRKLYLKKVIEIQKGQLTVKKKNIIINMDKLLKRIHFERPALEHIKLLKGIMSKGFAYIPLESYDKKLTEKTKLLVRIVSGEDEFTTETTLALINIVLGWFSIIFIFSACGIILSSKTIPFMNVTTSVLAGVLLVTALMHFYPFPEVTITYLSSFLTFIPNIGHLLSGIIYFLIAIVLNIAAFIKYRKISIETV